MIKDLEELVKQYRNSVTWYEKVRTMSLCHYFCLANIPKWSTSDTAKSFNLSKSTVSENLQIAEKFNELKGLGSRNKALKRLRGIS